MSFNQDEKKDEQQPQKSQQKSQPKPQKDNPLKDLPMEEAALIAAIADFIMTDAMKPHYVPFIWPSDYSSEDEKNCNIF